MTNTRMTAAQMVRGTVYRATPESVEPHLRTREDALKTAMVRHTVDGTPYVLVTKFSDSEVIAMFPPRTPTAWALSGNFAGQPIAERFLNWRGWGLSSGESVEVIDDRGEIEEFRARVHAAVTKEGRDRGWCSEADEWLVGLGLPTRGSNVTISITGTRRIGSGGTPDGTRRDLERVLVNAGITGLTVTVTATPETVSVF